MQSVSIALISSVHDYEVFLRLVRNRVIIGHRQGGHRLAGNRFRQKYIEEAESLFPVIAMLLNADLPDPLRLTTIREPQLEEADTWYLHPSRMVTWKWREILHKRRKKPKRLDVAFYCTDVLCGLMTASISRGRVGINIRYVEASPDPNHPLKGNFLYLALWQAELFATFTNCKQVSVSQPNPLLVQMYKDFGYEMVESDRKRELRGAIPKHLLLVKDIRDVTFDQSGQLG